MVKKSGLNVIDGGKPNDLVTVKVVIPNSGAFDGRCDLHTYENVLEALDEQGHIDLVDREGRKFRTYQCDGLMVVHMGTESRSAKLILPK